MLAKFVLCATDIHYIDCTPRAEEVVSIHLFKTCAISILVYPVDSEILAQTGIKL